jgi:hypothetical protein
MIKKHDAKRNKKTYEFKVGDLVSVAIPRIDRSGVEFSRLLGMICRVGGGNNEKKYRILTVAGILNDYYDAS